MTDQFVSYGCDCSDWAPNIKKVDGPIIMATIRAGRDTYDGKQFEFCPWCGSQLVRQRIVDEQMIKAEFGADG